MIQENGTGRGYRMAQKNNVQVVIDGKVYTLSGYEDPEYLNKVAAYINTKLSELRVEESFKRQNREVQNILMYLNVADDYYKAKKHADEFSLELEDRIKEVSGLKHQLVGLKLRMEEEEKELEELRKKVSEQEKTIVRLETEAALLNEKEELEEGQKTEEIEEKQIQNVKETQEKQKNKKEKKEQ